jgi:hypothetical protein
MVTFHWVLEKTNIFTNFTTVHFEAIKILLGTQKFAKIGFP